MPLNLPDGSSCFLDANILYYHFVDSPPLSEPCSELLERVAESKLAAFSSVHILAEAVHKIMLAEAAAKFGLNRAGLANWLQHHRQRIAELSHFRQAAGELALIGVSLIPTDAASLKEAADISAQMQLLTNDALMVALMRRQGLSNLVTNDDDFDDVGGDIKVWKPR